MAGLSKKNFSSPDETRPFEGKGKLDIVRVGDLPVGRGFYEPGWRWSVNLKPIAGTDSCQSLHVGYALSGRIRIKMNDGEEDEIVGGDVVHILPGHDAWVVGDEPFVFLDFGASVAKYAKR